MDDNIQNLFFDELDSQPVKHCEVVEPPSVPNPFSGNTEIKCLNKYNLQVLIYKGTSFSFIHKSVLRSASIENISQLLNILQI